jgi:hypothetical protein
LLVYILHIGFEGSALDFGVFDGVFESSIGAFGIVRGGNLQGAIDMGPDGIGEEFRVIDIGEQLGQGLVIVGWTGRFEGLD